MDDSKTALPKNMTALTRKLTAPATNRPGGLTAQLVPCGELDNTSVREMFRLYSSNYAYTSDAIFRRDLACKTHVLLLTRTDNSLSGFTTMELYRSAAAGQAVRVLFSGDTIIDPAYWGSPVLALEWIRFAGTIARSDPAPLYWLLIVKGHRTYRFLPAFAKRYIPHHDFPDAPNEKSILSALARDKFGDYYDDTAGVVRFPTPQGRLNDELADVPERHRRLRSVAHFLRLNPGYREGNELACLCRLAPENLRPFAARVFADEAERSR